MCARHPGFDERELENGPPCRRQPFEALMPRRRLRRQGAHAMRLEAGASGPIL
jgi:hypothetical protein